MPKRYTTKEFVRAFWSKVKKTRKCWLWIGARNTVKGENYGLVSVCRVTKRAHRIAYAMKYGELQKGEWVLHRCDNPPCVRWSHLFKGDAILNAADRANKGRGRYHRGRSHWTNRYPKRVARGVNSGRHTKPERTARGERHGMVKLSLGQVQKIKELMGKLSNGAIAKMFGVHKNTIRRIRVGIGWKV